MTTTTSPFLATLESAHANGLQVRIVEHVTGPRFSYDHHYAAKTISHIVEERRRGLVVVMTDLTRVAVKNITSVTVEQPPATSHKTTAPGLSATGKPYTIACGAGIAKGESA